MTSVVIDIENGGFSRKAGIVEIGAIIVDEDLNEIDRKSWIVNRYFIQGTEELCEYTEKSIEIHGITVEIQEKEGIPPKQVCVEFLNFMRRYKVERAIGHNIRKFDIRRLDDFYEQWYPLKHGTSIFEHITDTMEYARGNFDFESNSLGAICEHYGIINENSHRSLSDCQAALEAYKAMKADFENQ